MNIKQILLELRNEREISQQALADAVGISQSTIAKIELGRNEATASTIRKLADFFNVSADYIIGRTDELGGMVAPVSPPVSPLSADEQRLLKNFRTMRADLRPSLISMSETLAKTPDEIAGNTQKKKHNSFGE